MPIPRTLALVTIAGALLTGCAVTPPPLADVPEAAVLRDDADFLRRESEAWNFSHFGLKDRPWLGSDREVRLRADRLRDADPASDTFAADARALLQHMEDLGREDATVLAPDDAEMTTRLDAVHAAEERLLAEALRSPETAESWLDDVRDALPREEPNPGATWRALSAAPAWPFVEGWIAWHAAHEWRGENWHDFASARVYRPQGVPLRTTIEELATASEDELLALYTPILVQELAEAPDFRDDRVGTPELVPDTDGEPVGRVDDRTPAIYGFVSHALVQDQWLPQLNYSFWYNDHPAAKDDDPEAGMVEGQLLRITLGPDRRPLLSEATYACGCYHRIYPVAELEESARAEWGEPVNGSFSLADRVTHRIDPAIPELAGTFDPSAPHPLVYVRSGFHMIAAVKWDPLNRSMVAETESMTLRPAADLERLAWGEDTMSLFGRDGLVRGADRPEARLLYPSGMYHAGTPRVRGMRKIHFDDYDYDDPTLLETMLRFPDLTGGRS